MLVDRDVAKAHLRLTTPDGHPTDLDFDQKLAAAEAAIVDYVMRNEPGKTTAPTWTDPTTTPANVREAVLIVLAERWRFRGDDPGGSATSAGRTEHMDFPDAVIGLLRRFTDPVLA